MQRLRALVQPVRLGSRRAVSASAATAQTGAQRVDTSVNAARYDELIEAEITHLSTKQPHPLSLQEILSHKVPATLAHFLRDEIAVRYATRIKVLEESVSRWRSVRELALVRRLYADSFKALRDAKPDEPAGFREVVNGIRKRHDGVVRLLVAGMSTIRRTNAMDVPEIDQFLDAFFASRIGTEILTTHYLMLSDDKKPNPSGIITPDVDVAKVISSVASRAELVAQRAMQRSPKVEVTVVGGEPVRMVFIQQYFSYIIFELLKNSFRAVVEAGQRNRIRELPPVRVTVSCDNDMVGVKIRDQGGGIPLEHLESIWSYTFTTAPNPQHSISPAHAVSHSPLAGFGCGLPLSLQYAKYLGGWLDVVSVPGYGATAFLGVPRPGDTAEMVPGSMTLSARTPQRIGARPWPEQRREMPNFRTDQSRRSNNGTPDAS